MKKYSIALLALLLCIHCTQKKEMHITEISQKDIKSDILLDVRTPEEYEEGHLDNSLNINWYDEDFIQQAGKLDNKKNIYIYCRRGTRSANAAHVLDSMGYRTIDLLGGYEAWLADK